VNNLHNSFVFAVADPHNISLSDEIDDPCGVDNDALELLAYPLHACYVLGATATGVTSTATAWLAMISFF
jgi:hypothetical protein